MSGSGRGDLGSYGGSDYIQLRDYLLENPVTKVPIINPHRLLPASLLSSGGLRQAQGEGRAAGRRRVVQRSHTAQQGIRCVYRPKEGENVWSDSLSSWIS
jgi:hypothetical protein